MIVEGMHSPQFAHMHKTQHMTTTHVGTLNILEHSFSIYVFIYSHLSLDRSLVHSLLLSHLLCQMRYINSVNIDNVTRSQMNVLPHSSLIPMNGLDMRLTTQPHAIPSTTHI